MNDRQFNLLDRAACTLLIIGGFNWGLVGLFHFDGVSAILQSLPLIRTVYVLVGMSAVYSLYLIYKMKKTPSLRI